MPSNKNAFTRYKVLDELLSSRYHNYTIDDIVDSINDYLVDLGIEPVTRRCVEKDIAYLKGEHSPFMADIEGYYVDVFNGENTVRKKCLRYADPSFSIFKKEMTDEEAYLLYHTLSLLGQFEGLPQLDELNRLKVGLIGHKIEDKKIIEFTKNPLENSNLFGLLYTTIAQKQVIKLTYHTFADLNSKKPILFHPYLLKEYNRRWFLFGAADSDGKLLNFGLDQIDKVEPIPAQKFKPSDEALEEYFDDIVGVSKKTGSEAEKIEFWVSNYSKNYVITKPIHESQILYKNESDSNYRLQYPMLNEGAFFSIICVENYELIRELSSFGAELIVLSPKHIQDRIVQTTGKILAIYSSIRI